MINTIEGPGTQGATGVKRTILANAILCSPLSF